MLAAMQVAEARPGYELWRPNREKAECKTMKVVIAFVLLVLILLVRPTGLLGESLGKARA